MTEQLTLFNFPATETIKPIHDPYWDEIVREQEPSPTVEVGDWVKLSADWMNELAAVTKGKFKKDYKFKSEAELVCKVIWVDPLGNGHIYVSRGNDNALFVPKGCFVREQVIESTLNTEFVREQKPYQNAPEQTHWVEEYWVKRGGNKHYYYRYCWMEGRKIQRCHIGKKLEKKQAVENAIADGQTPQEIKQMLRGWKT
jgi:hypothetical protein